MGTKRNHSGLFKEGNKGKPKGAISKKTKMWEALGEYIVNDGSERAMRYLNEQEDKDFFTGYMAMLEYFKPRQSRVDANNSGSIDINIKKTIHDDRDQS